MKVFTCTSLAGKFLAVTERAGHACATASEFKEGEIQRKELYRLLKTTELGTA
jgi:hypothetical protein